MFKWLNQAVHAERYCTAIHEAGHQVVKYRLGLAVGPVNIRRDDVKGILGRSLGEDARRRAAIPVEADFIMDCVAEGENWRARLAEYRRILHYSR